MHPLTCCHFETKYVLDSKSSAFTNLVFRLVKLVQSYFTLIPIVSQESLLYLKKKTKQKKQNKQTNNKKKESTIAGHPLGFGFVWMSTYFFFQNLATYCSSLLGLWYNIFLLFCSLSCAHLRLHANDAQFSDSARILRKKH